MLGLPSNEESHFVFKGVSKKFEDRVKDRELLFDSLEQWLLDFKDVYDLEIEYRALEYFIDDKMSMANVRCPTNKSVEEFNSINEKLD